MRFVQASVLCVVAGCSTAVQRDDVVLFDGKSLEGWHRHPKAPGGDWEVIDGVLVGREDANAQGGFLATGAVYGDVIIDLDVRMDWPFDSGVFLRVGPDGISHQVTLDYRPGGEIGAIYVPWGAGFVCHAPAEYICGDTPGSIATFADGRWHHVRILIEGEPALIQFWLDGVLVTDFLHSEATTRGIPREGSICLQVHGGVEGAAGKGVYFRNIRVRPLDGAPPAD